MLQIAVTFQAKYNNLDNVHPFDKRITGNHYMVFEGEDYAEARNNVVAVLGQDWAFDYIYATDDGNGLVLDDDFADQVSEYGLIRYQPDFATKRHWPDLFHLIK